LHDLRFNTAAHMVRHAAVNSADDEFFVATSDSLSGSTGKFYVARRVKSPPPPAQDEAACGRLWKVLEDLSGFSYS